MNRKNIGALKLIGMALFFPFSCVVPDRAAHRPINDRATAETVRLYNSLFSISKRGTMVGHQDALSYGHAWHGEAGRSDVKDLTGKHPAVIGWDLGYLELGSPLNLDSVHFADMKRDMVSAFQTGSIVTCSWHGNNIVTGQSTWDNGRQDVVGRILKGADKHDEYLAWLDRIGRFFLSLEDGNGKLVPVVFRLYHEHTGDWFWWGNKQCSPQEYIALWKMTVDHLQGLGVNNLLYAYSSSEVTSEEAYLERYPGDGYVDIIGFDAYVQDSRAGYVETMETNLKVITQYAEKSGKLPIIAETGYESLPDSVFFTETVYPLLERYDVAWILFWRNAWESARPEHHYLPFQGHGAADDFVKFTEKPDILLQGDFDPIE